MEYLINFVRHTFRKSPHVSMTSKFTGVLMAIMALMFEFIVVMQFVEKIQDGFPTRAEAVEKVMQETGLPRELVELYTQSALGEDRGLVFAAVGQRAQVRFNRIEDALDWGGTNPFFKVQLGEETHKFYGQRKPSQSTNAAGEAIEDGARPLEVELFLPAADWGEKLGASARDIVPTMVFTVTQASPDILHFRVPAYASFDLKYAKPKETYNFVNYRREARNNFQEFEVVIASAEEGALLDGSREHLELSEVTLGDYMVDLLGGELVVLVFALLSLWLFRGGLDRKPQTR